MIDSIHLVNIQKHKDLTLSFSPNVNVIYGATDSGKTSVIRGLLWGLLNEGIGDKLITHGEKSCNVTISIDGHIIKRGGGTKNTYTLDGMEYKSFRSDVPKPIADIVNIGDVSVQHRRDLPFMVYFKGSENSEQFSQMLNLQEIQCTITNINKYVKTTQDKKELNDERLHECEQELMQIPDLTGAERRISDLCIRAEYVQSLTAERTCLSDTFQEARLLSSRVKYLKPVNSGLSDLESISSKCDTVQGLRTKDIQLRFIASDYDYSWHITNKYKRVNEADDVFTSICNKSHVNTSLTKTCDQLKAIYTHCTQVVSTTNRLKPMNIAIKCLDSIADKYNIYKELRQKRYNLNTICNQYESADKNVASKLEELNQAQKDWDSIKGEVCPLCGNTLGDCNESK